MAIEDDHLESGHGLIEYSDLDDSVLDLNFTSGDPPPYHDDLNEDAHSKLLGPLPSYEDVQTEDNRRSFIKTTVISVITVLICVFIIISVFLYFLYDEEVPTITKNTSPRPGRPGQGPSQNGVLNFVKEYPKLKPTTTFECRFAWDRLIEVPCHRSMWRGDWEDGVLQMPGPSFDELLPLVCDQSCTSALLEAQKGVGSACAGQRAFILDGYSGIFNSELLDAGPAKVIDDLVEKTRHICRKPSNNEADTGFCLIDLESEWGIFDRFRSNGLAGLERFISATSMPRQLLGGFYQGTPPTNGPARRVPNLREERRFGPTKNSTTCSSCTLKWFEEKLSMWDNKNMQSWSLPRFLRNWEEAGKRCEGNGFYKIFNAAVQSYKDAGLLEDLWDHLPSGDTSYLVAHGPTRGDVPVSWSLNAIPTVKKYRSSYPKATTSQIIQHAALNDEYVTCLEAFATAGQDLPCYPFLNFPGIKEHILSSPQIAQAACSEACFTAISTFAQAIWDACPSARFARWDVYDNNLPSGLKYTLGFNLANYVGDHGTIVKYQAACHRAVGRDGIPCGAIYAKWGKEEWIFSESSPKPKELIRITRQQLKALPLMPTELKDLKPPTDRPITWQYYEAQAELAAWRTKMDAGICSYCMWRQYVPYKGTVEMIQSVMPHPALGDEVMMEWIKTVHLMRSECQARGIQFPEQELADIDIAWTQKHSQALLDEALREGRPEPDWVA